MSRAPRRHVTLLAGLAGIALATGTLGSGGTATAARQPARPRSPIYLDTSYRPAERAADLVSRMTLEEKAQEMNSSQAQAIPRLGVAAWGWWNESNHGVNASTITPTGNATTLTNTTSYPSDLSMGSTWDPDLVRREASLIGDEARDTAPDNTQNLDFYAPTVNLARDPRWGRNDEAWSEDPTLTAMLAGQYVNGLQGQNKHGRLPASAHGYYKAIATLKHYAANNSEVNRRTGSADMDQRTLREYYTKQFADIVESAHPGSIMSAYNEVNGVPAAASVQLMNDLARDTYGFDGYFTSDCDAVREIQNGHHWQPPNASAPLDQYGRTAYAISAGEDLDCNWGYHDQYSYGNTIPTAIAQHIETEMDTFNVGDVDTSLVRLFTARIETGEFDRENKVPWVRAARERLGGTTWVSDESNNAITETPARLAQAQKSAEESLVLLKNDQVGGSSLLPLKVPSSRPYKIAVVGYFAHPSAGIYTGGYSSHQVGAGAANNIDAYTGIKAAVQKRNPQAQVDYLPGVTGGTTAASLTTVDQATLDAVQDYDAVVVVAGTDYSTASEDHDRSSTALPGAQASMIQQVEAANPHTVVYLETVGSVDLGGFADSSPAILWSSYNGQRQGAALATVLLGSVDPSAHLPFTWYADDSQLPSITDYAIRPTDGSPGRTYMYFTGQPSYSFGHGLSYTRFRYSHLTVARPTVDAEGTVRATVVVTNTGHVAGAAVPQLYATTPNAPASAERPTKRLVDFERVELRPGQSRKVTFSVQASALAFYDEDREVMKVDTGRYGLQLGASSSDVVQRAAVRVTGTLGQVPTTVTARPIQRGDRAAGVYQRVAFDVGTRIDPQLTVATDDEKLHGYISRGRSTALPQGLSLRYSSNRPKVVAVRGDRLRTVGSGIATVTVTATYHHRSVRESFVVNVAPLQITSNPTANLTSGEAASVTVTTATTQSPTPQEVPTLTVRGTLPAGLSFTDNGDGTGTISGTPTAPGTSVVKVKATNQVSPPATQELTITVG